MPITPVDEADAAACRLLAAHCDAADYRPCVAAAARLGLPAALSDAAALRRLAALAIAQGFGLIAGRRAAAVGRAMHAALAGAAESLLDRVDTETLMHWCIAVAEWCERNGLDRPFQQLQARVLRADALASPWSRVHWRIAAAWHHEAFGRGAAVAEQLDEAQAIADAAGERSLQVPVALKQARLALARRDPQAALRRADWVEAQPGTEQAPLWLADAADVRARAALIDGVLHEALHQARRCDGLARLAQAPPAYTLTYRLNEAYALLGLGAQEEAAALLRTLATQAPPAQLRERLGLLLTLFELLGDEAAGRWGAAQRERLRALLRRLRALSWSGVLVMLPAQLARLWARALEEGIETAWVRASIRSRALPPPEPAWPSSWPWRLRLRVLGPFSAELDEGVLLEAGSKAASRPLALLRHLAAHAGLDAMPAEQIAQALWPGEGREGRDKALEVTIARLRRLLGDAELLLVQDRRLRLNPQRVWVDRVAFERLCDRLVVAGDAGPAQWRQLWSLWRGPLLAELDDSAGLQALRRPLRLRLAAALAATAARAGHRARCLRALAADPGLAGLL